MARLRFHHTVLPIAMGFAFRYVSRNLESIGDVHSVLGNKSGALSFHSAALICLLGAFACFIFAGVKIARYFWGRKDRYARPHSPAPLSRGWKEAEVDDTPFDPDAVMTRYLAERNAVASKTSASRPSPLEPMPHGFGRKSSRREDR